MTQTTDISVAAEAGIKHCFGALILLENDLSAEFLDLRAGLSGELFQKLSNDLVMTVPVVPDPARYGARFSERAFEHATHNLIRLVDSPEAARAWPASAGAP